MRREEKRREGNGRQDKAQDKSWGETVFRWRSLVNLSKYFATLDSTRNPVIHWELSRLEKEERGQMLSNREFFQHKC